MSTATQYLPTPNAVSAPYWQGCREGKLLLQYCARCDTHQFYPRACCARCAGSVLAWREASGMGHIKSFTVIRRAVSAAYESEAPYVVALIELAEGPTMMSNIVTIAPDDVRIGARVYVQFEAWNTDTTVPVFRLAE